MRNFHTIPEFISAIAARDPTAIAMRHRIDDRWSPVTWRDAYAQMRSLAAAWSASGIGRGDHIAILAATSHRWQIAECAAYLLGAVVVGIDPRAGATGLEAAVRACAIRACVVDEPASIAVLPQDVRSSLVSLVSMRDAQEGIRGWDEVLASASAHDAPMTDPEPGDDALIVHTSGTSGTPRSIAYTHAQVLLAVTTLSEEFPFTSCPGDRMIAWLPMSALFQRIMNMFAWSRGITVCYLENPRQLPQSIAQVEPTYFVGLPRFYEKFFEAAVDGLPRRPAVLRRWLERSLRTPPARGTCTRALLERLVYPRLRQALGKNLRVLVSGSAPLAPWLLTALSAAGLEVLEAYGLSENIVPMASNRLGAVRFGSVGKPFSTSTIRFAENGEIEVAGPGVFTGYLAEGRPAERFTVDGFYRTGDLGHLDGDGFLHLTGRTGEIIKTSTGRRIAPAAIEEIYRQVPAVDHVVVIGDGRKRLVALVTLRRDRLAEHLSAVGIDAREAARAETSRAVHDWLMREFARVDMALPAYERVAAIAILPRSLEIERGELTASFKLRRAAILANHADAVAALDAELL